MEISLQSRGYMLERELDNIRNNVYLAFPAAPG